VIGRKIAVQKGQHLDQQSGKIVAGRLAIAFATQGEGVERRTTWSTTDTEVDAAGIERVKHAKRFHDLQRAVMRQQDGAGADPDRGSFAGDAVHQYFRRWAGKRGNRMMFSDPITMVAEPVGEAGKLDCIVEGVGWSRSSGHGRLINNRKLHKLI
jgi:hypothetical protein